MDPVLQRLNEIELSAKKIMDNAEAEKPAIAEEMKRKTAEFDKKTDAETAARIESSHAAMKAQNDRQLEKLRSDIEEATASVQNHYDEHHSKWADDIVSSVLNDREFHQ